MSASVDRSVRFVFDSVADSYVSGRPEMPLDAVRDAVVAMRLPASARVLEVGAGAGQLTGALVAAGFQVVALEPGGELRERARHRVPQATFRADTFEEYESDSRFDAIFSANAFHWVDPSVGYGKAARLADALVLMCDTPVAAEPGLRRRIQDGVMIPHGSTFPTEEADVRRMVTAETERVCDEIRASGQFQAPWSRVYERTLLYTPERYLDLIGSQAGVASSGRREAILAELRPVLGDDPFDVLDLVWVIAVRVAPSAEAPG